MQAGFISLLSWIWLSTMMPQTEAWSTPLLNYSNFIAGLLTVFAMIFAKDKIKFPVNTFTILFFLFVILFTLSQIFSFDRDLSATQFRIGITTLFMAFATMMLTNSKIKIQIVLWIFVLSVGYFGITRGLYTIASAGGGIVTGPSGTVLADNNQLAVGLAMMVPIAFYLFRTSTDKKAQLMSAGISTLSIFAIIGTHSRGGLISLGVLVFGLLMRSKKKFLSLFIFAFVATASLTLMPDKWFERMDTISNVEEDSSFMARVAAWEVAYKTGLQHPILGVGPRLQYYPEYNTRVGASYNFLATHNAYLEIMAGNGLLAMLVFIGMMATTFFWCSNVRKLTKGRQGYLWANDLAGMLQLSMVVYGVGVIALSMEFWFGVWLNMVLILNLRELVLRELKLIPVAVKQEEAYA